MLSRRSCPSWVAPGSNLRSTEPVNRRGVDGLFVLRYSTSMTTEKDKNPLGFFEGQAVVIKSRSRGYEQEGRIVKMKRTRMDVAIGPCARISSYLIESGHEKEYDSWTWVTTQAVLDDEAERAALKIRLRDAGLVYSLGSGQERKVSTPNLRALVELAERIKG